MSACDNLLTCGRRDVRDAWTAAASCITHAFLCRLQQALRQMRIFALEWLKMRQKR